MNGNGTDLIAINDQVPSSEVFLKGKFAIAAWPLLLKAVKNEGSMLHRDMTDTDCFKRGNPSYAQGKYEEAIADYTWAIRLNPDYADAYTNRGVLYQTGGKHKEAIADFTRVISSGRINSANFSRRGHAYYSQGKYNEAIADHTRAIQLNPHNVYSYNGLGNVYYALYMREEATASYTRAIQLDPDDTESYRWLIKNLETYNNSYQFLPAFKKLPFLKQIPLLRVCLDRNTILGKNMVKNIRFLDWFWDNPLQQMQNHLASMEQSMLITIFLMIPGFCNNRLKLDLSLHITSYFLKLSGLGVIEVNRHLPDIHTFQKSIFEDHPENKGMVKQGF